MKRIGRDPKWQGRRDLNAPHYSMTNLSFHLPQAIAIEKEPRVGISFSPWSTSTGIEREMKETDAGRRKSSGRRQDWKVAFSMVRVHKLERSYESSFPFFFSIARIVLANMKSLIVS
jgi:hypothetical protein